MSSPCARLQANRVAAARRLPPVQNLKEGQIHQRQLGFLGEPTVNVPDLNRALDTLGPDVRARSNRRR